MFRIPNITVWCDKYAALFGQLFFFCLPQSVVSGVTTAYNREQLWLANETLITKLQARCRGYLVRKGLRERMEYLKSNEPAVTNIQVRRTPPGEVTSH